MESVTHRLILISRDSLLAAEDDAIGRRVFRRLANLTRQGHHVLLTAPEPDHWLPTRGNVDNALSDQGKLQQAVHDCGGDLDGVYYVPRSRFTQDRNRDGALQDILARYGVAADQALLISASRPFLRSGERLGIETCEILKGSAGAGALLDRLDSLSE